MNEEPLSLSLACELLKGRKWMKIPERPFRLSRQNCVQILLVVVFLRACYLSSLFPGLPLCVRLDGVPSGTCFCISEKGVRTAGSGQS